MARQLKAMDSGWERQLTQPRENAFLKLNTNSNQLICDVQRCLGDFGSLAASTTFPGETIVELIDQASTYTEVKLVVRTFDVDGKPRTSGGDPLDVRLRLDDTSMPIAINDLNDGTYELSFRVQNPGDYVVDVDIFGRPIKNSPFPVSVSSHHPPKWQLPVELHQPVKVAINGDHVLYVLDTGNERVRIVKETGEVISDLKPPCLVGGTAVGMALLSGGDMAILNWRTKSITRLGPKGDEIQSINFSEFNEPIDLAADHRGRYLIADAQKVMF
ncbi:Filamin/ABP280 repeat protein [Ancylostoma ceylanicum]|uniref:Filamin/ABP280 repeat protein n=1 Tax=Ancylostoma ceylanicum TaxID=53326 RepID=A0A0D6LW21_9BILA|nr:Filamin/ABP280 repeat protein [Ancylostoma ceylanicum]